MAELTQEQLSFLEDHGIRFSSLFDASGMGRAAYQKAMEKDDRYFAFGVSRCKRGPHSIRTRAGHCIQCNHAAIAIVFREDVAACIWRRQDRDVRIAGAEQAEDDEDDDQDDLERCGYGLKAATDGIIDRLNNSY